MSDADTKCRWPHCRNEPEITYLGAPLCQAHWLKISEIDDQECLEAFKRKLGIKRK